MSSLANAPAGSLSAPNTSGVGRDWSGKTGSTVVRSRLRPAQTVTTTQDPSAPETIQALTKGCAVAHSVSFGDCTDRSNRWRPLSNKTEATSHTSHQVEQARCDHREHRKRPRALRPLATRQPCDRSPIHIHHTREKPQHTDADSVQNCRHSDVHHSAWRRVFTARGETSPKHAEARNRLPALWHIPGRKIYHSTAESDETIDARASHGPNHFHAAEPSAQRAVDVSGSPGTRS